MRSLTDVGSPAVYLIQPDKADVLHSLRRLLVPQHDFGGALDLLRRANEVAPDNAHSAYV
jgi:hypothetical protein